MRKIILFLVSLLIGLSLFGLVTSSIGIDEIAKAFSSFPVEGLVIILFISFLIVLVGIWRLKFILKTQGYYLSFWKVAEIWFGGFTISYFTPIAIFGGEVFMIYGLKKAFSVPWEKASAAVFIHRVLDATIFFPFLVIGLFTFPFLAGTFPKTKVIIAGSIVAAIIIFLLAIFYIKTFRKESTLEWFLRLFGLSRKKLQNQKGGELVLGAEKEILSFFGLKKGRMWKGLAISLLKYFLILIRCVMLIFFFGGSWHLLRALSAYGFFNLATLVPVPAMLGSLEIAESIVFSGIGMGANVGVAFSFVLRSMDLLCAMIGFLLLIKFGIKLIKIKIGEFIDKVISNRNSLFIA